MAFQQVIGIGAIFWFKDLASKQILNAKKNMEALKNATTFTQKLELTRNIGLIQMASGLRQMAVGAGLLAPAIAGISTMKFDEQVLRTSQVLEESNYSISQFRDKLLDMSKNTPFSPEDITSALYELGSAGLSASKAYSVLNDALWFGKIANIGYSDSTLTIVKALNAFGWEVKDTTKVLDLMVNLEQQSLIHYKDMPQFFSRVGKTVAETEVDPYTATVLASELMSKGTERRLSGTRTAGFFRSLSTMFGKKKVQSYLEEAEARGHRVVLFDKKGNRLPLVQQVQNLMSSIRAMGVEKFGNQKGKIDAYVTTVLNTIFGQAGSEIPKYLENFRYQKGKGVITGYEGFLQALADIQRRGTYQQKKKQFENLEVNKYTTALNNLKVAWIRFGGVVLPITVSILNKLGVVISGIDTFVKRFRHLVYAFSVIGVSLGVIKMGIGAVNTVIGIGRLLYAETALSTIKATQGLNALSTALSGVSIKAGLAYGIIGALTVALASYLIYLNRQRILAEQEYETTKKNFNLQSQKRLVDFNEKYGTTLTNANQMYAMQAMATTYYSYKDSGLSKEQLRAKMMESAINNIRSLYQDELNSASLKEKTSIEQKIREDIEALKSQSSIENLEKFLKEQKIDVDVKVLIDGSELKTAIVKYDKKVKEAQGEGSIKNKMETSPMGGGKIF